MVVCNISSGDTKTSDVASDDKMTIILVVHNVSSDDKMTITLVVQNASSDDTMTMALVP